MDNCTEKNILEEYLRDGVQNILMDMVKASAANPKASLFIMRHMMDSKRAALKRSTAQKKGEHIPPFLIASITTECNLHCKGCYARANHSCHDAGACGQLSDDGMLSGNEWGSIFSQAEDMGVEFILLAGGEPFNRKDILTEAGKHQKIIFPVFTNGTMIDKAYIHLLDQKRNIMPIISIEGNKETTDTRRGKGVYDMIRETMKQLQKKDIMFGTSITVTNENMDEVLSDSFVDALKGSGAKAAIYVEYVPVNKAGANLAPDDETREKMLARIEDLRQRDEGMIYIAFPGDEKNSGGCLAAGRGFFHINARGGAEPCPFSPFSDTNLRNVTLREALNSPLFRRLRSDGSLTESHTGGCVLYAQEAKVKSILKEQAI